nr:hypothetical protein [Teredinibacter franksiae]
MDKKIALRDKASFNSELHLCNFLGEDYWLQCSFIQTGDVDGCACIIDISDSHAEAEKSRESARFFMHMQDQLQDLFYYKDSNSRFQGGREKQTGRFRFYSDGCANARAGRFSSNAVN